MRDAASGIQRVTKNLLHHLLTDPPSNIRVEPVYASLNDGYRYARRFTKRFLGLSQDDEDDDLIDFGRGDIFLGLDLQPHVVPQHAQFFQQLMTAGTSLQFVVYDLLPIQLPEAFPAGSAEVHARWLGVVAESDGAICISNSVAKDLTEWVSRNASHRVGRLTIRSLHLGANPSHALATTGQPSNAPTILRELNGRPTFSMVGTIEPRKAHAQVLAGFERLWAAGTEVNLVVVGKAGWLTDDTLSRLTNHPERGRRLHWLSDASDEFLETIYRRTDCLIAASWAEGFGLPLVEASQHQIPIIAREIAVFREVAGSHALYFSGGDAEAIESVVATWLDRSTQGTTITSEGMPVVTWQESAAQLMSHLRPTTTAATSG